jgi:hypothetical protein
MDAETRGMRDELPKGAQRARAVGRRLVGLAWGDETTAKARNSLAAWSIRSWRAAGGRSATGRVERRNDRVMINNALERSKSTFWLEPIPGLEATFFPIASPRAPVVDALEGAPASKAERSSSRRGRRIPGGSAEAAPAGGMVYTRTVELSRLGAGWLGASVNNATSAYEDVVVALANTTDPFSIPAAPDHYAGYDKESVCFVEPMVRFMPRKTRLAALSASGPPRFRARSRVLQCLPLLSSAEKIRARVSPPRASNRTIDPT